MKQSIVLFLFFWLILGFDLEAQSHKHRYYQHHLHEHDEKCGTHILQELQSQDFDLETTQFEDWLQGQKEIARFQNEEEVFILPVVVHIVHNGEDEGIGTNIPMEQIESQIRILNEDFRRTNADTAQTQNIFRDVAADIKISFQLAKRDPNGLPTDGVTRTQGTRTSYRLSDNSELKAIAYWPSDQYINIWVAPLAGNLLGWAQFPVSTLPGLSPASSNPLTDGIVVRSTFFGDTGNVNSNSLGRTATHEMGHYLGLRHVWGDGGCNATDFCDDTPFQQSPTAGCPTSQESCDSPDMFQNYMDYSTDVCMNIFTLCQRTRMRTVLMNSPRRTSLINSPALNAPDPIANDLGINKVVSPGNLVCEDVIIPQIELINFGSNEITQASIELRLQDQLIQVFQLTEPLESFQSTIIDFDPIDIDPLNSNLLAFEIVSTNNAPDANQENTFITKVTDVAVREDLPISADFRGFPDNWRVSNVDESITWALTQAPFLNNSDPAIFMNLFDYESGIGTRDRLISSVFDLSDFVDAKLIFRYAYANFPAPNANDEFIVSFQENCGETIDFENTLFAAAGANLATAPPTEEPFIPEGSKDWNWIEIDLSEQLGMSDLVIVFETINSWGNNLYLADVSITGTRLSDNKIQILDIIHPQEIVCENQLNPQVEIRNLSFDTLNTLEGEVLLDGVLLSSFRLNDLAISSLESLRLLLDTFELSNSGSYEIEIVFTNVEGSPSISRRFNFEDQVIQPPLRALGIGQNTGNWSIINQDDDFGFRSDIWETEARTQNILRANAFSSLSRSARTTYYSPPIDLSGQREEIFLTMSYSYRRSANATDEFYIAISEDCGKSFIDTISIDLNTPQFTNAPWRPQTEDQWNTLFWSLEEYQDASNLLLAFSFVSNFGNDFYLKDIQINTTRVPNQARPELNNFTIFPNPANDRTQVRVEWDEPNDVLIEVFNTKGQQMLQQQLPNSLNQTYGVNLLGVPPGTYIMRITSGGIQARKRFIVR
ncbi:MAG: T9SS type A sorting domain-containing protein [Cyclobacteriaceae bacterium]|nr:T9SS type A sorting domain-containing protein [Cyclobacteriaceae bacterium]MCH8515948.1 T9SS type A sorting domain-containing protein [Cyclobacteriaceae bacterium]